LGKALLLQVEEDFRVQGRGKSWKDTPNFGRFVPLSASQEMVDVSDLAFPDFWMIKPLLGQKLKE
jgi:hypothetical protein